MTQSNRDTQPSVQDVALIVGGGPGISSSCARLFAENGMRVGVAARNPGQAGPADSREDARRASIRLRCKRTGGRGAAVRECRSRPRDADACRAQHRRPGSRHFPQERLPKPTRAWCSRHFETRRSARFWSVSRPLGSCAKTNPTPTARKERSSSRTPARRSKASRRAVPLRWHVMPSPDSRRAWRGN